MFSVVGLRLVWVQAGCFLLLVVDCLVRCGLLKLGCFWCFVVGCGLRC